jgi:hypothetical protein
MWDEERLSNATVLLYQPPQPTDTAGEIGAGTLIADGPNYYLMTATHVAKMMRSDAKLYLHLAGDRPAVVGLLSTTGDTVLEWHNHPIADISMIRLMPRGDSVGRRIMNCAFPLHQISMVDQLPNRDVELTFLGFPVIDPRMAYFSPLVFAAYRSSGLMTQPRADTRTDCTFFFLNQPSIQGCSGSGVFCSVKKAIFSDMGKTFLIGVVHATMSDNTGGKMAMVTPSFYILNFFAK